MATNLFEAFDRAFAEPRPSMAATLIAGLAGRIDQLLRRRRRAREMREVQRMPPHLLRDIGLLAP